MSRDEIQQLKDSMDATNHRFDALDHRFSEVMQKLESLSGNKKRSGRKRKRHDLADEADDEEELHGSTRSQLSQYSQRESLQVCG